MSLCTKHLKHAVATWTVGDDKVSRKVQVQGIVSNLKDTMKYEVMSVKAGMITQSHGMWGQE